MLFLDLGGVEPGMMMQLICLQDSVISYHRVPGRLTSMNLHPVLGLLMNAIVVF
jgi:hypothetical protein